MPAVVKPEPTLEESMTSTTLSKCPECDAGIRTEDVRPGEIVECGDCASELEVVTVSPVALAVAPEVEEDWGE
jgi:alpha-aminoadipate carrier protein LysW